MTVRVIKKDSFKDKRGLLWTTWKKKEFDKINFNHALLFPLVLLCLLWCFDGKYVATILTIVFGFVLYAVFEDSKISKEHSSSEEE